MKSSFFLGFFLCFLKDRVRASAEVLLPARDLRKLRDRGIDLARYSRDVRTDLSQDRAHHAFLLIQHRRENMFRLDLLVLILFGDTDRLLNGLLAAYRKPVESHSFIVNDEGEWRESIPPFTSQNLNAFVKR